MSSAPEGNRIRRQATVYDAVAGHVGLLGLLKPEELGSSRVELSAPEEVLLRRIGAPDIIPYDYYNADERLYNVRELPDSDLLTAIHAYTSDFYKAATPDSGLYDFRSLDETALLAVGVLLEEAALEALGKTGDMALTEPEGLQEGASESKMTKYQIIGKVKPGDSPQHASGHEDEDEEDKKPHKRRK